MKVIAYIHCGGKVLNGKADQVRSNLMDLLPKYHDVDSAADTSENECCESDDQTVEDAEAQSTVANIKFDVTLEDMTVGECVEVYWKGDRVWYEGRIIAVDTSEKQFEVEYFLDGETLLHNAEDYKVRMSC